MSGLGQYAGRLGFTLAEVLITLGIIGVVSALTLPSLISNVDAKRNKTQFKKTISVLSQAGATAKALYNFDYGSSFIQNCSFQIAGMKAEVPQTSKTYCALFNSTIKYSDVNSKAWNISKYSLNRAGVLTRDTLIGAQLYILLDGSYIGFNGFNSSKNGENACTLPVGEIVTGAWIDAHPQCVGYIDVNGKDYPNEEVKCSEGDTTTEVENPCEVKEGKDVGDIYPIVFHDSDVTPASNASMYVWQN